MLLGWFLCLWHITAHIMRQHQPVTHVTAASWAGRNCTQLIQPTARPVIHKHFLSQQRWWLRQPLCCRRCATTGQWCATCLASAAASLYRASVPAVVAGLGWAPTYSRILSCFCTAKASCTCWLAHSRFLHDATSACQVSVPARHESAQAGSNTGLSACLGGFGCSNCDKRSPTQNGRMPGSGVYCPSYLDKCLDIQLAA
jgi:hypothetical protein